MGWLENFGIMLLLALIILAVGYGILRGVDIIAYLSEGGCLRDREAFSRYMIKRRRADARLLGVEMREHRVVVEVQPYDYDMVSEEEGVKQAEELGIMGLWERFDTLYFRFPNDLLYVDPHYAMGLLKPIFQQEGGDDLRERVFFVWDKTHTDLHFTVGDLVDALEGKPVDFYGENNDT